MAKAFILCKDFVYVKMISVLIVIIAIFYVIYQFSVQKNETSQKSKKAVD